jgi:hypothetical protein
MLVYPIPKEKWILKLPANGIKAPQRRKSPKRGHVADVFWELVSFPDLLKSPNFSLEVLMTQEEEVRRYVGRGRWKNRGWAVQERRLLGVLERHLFDAPESFMGLLPPRLPDQFTTRELAEAMGATRRFAQRVAYCIREMGLIHQVGKRGRSNLYSRTAMDSEL